MVMVTVWGEALLLLSVKLVELLLARAAVLLNVPLAMLRVVLTGNALTGAKATPRNTVLAAGVARAVPKASAPVRAVVAAEAASV